MATASSWQTFSDELSAIAEQVGKSVVAIHSGHRHGASGIFWRNEVVITADHLLREEEVTIVISPGKSVKAEVIGRDPVTDVAVLRISDANGLKAATFGGASDLKIGNFVLALGRSRRGNLVASSGIISGLMGPWRSWHGPEIEQFIRPDLMLYPGFSGGPLVNYKGQIIGMNTAGLRRATPITVPHTTIERIAEELSTRGAVARPYLGLAVRPVQLPQKIREEAGLGGSYGVLVMQLESGGPADKAGILIGDVLVKADGKALEDTEDLLDLLAKKRIGDQFEASMVRGGKLMALQIKLNERPKGN